MSIVKSLLSLLLVSSTYTMQPPEDSSDAILAKLIPQYPSRCSITPDQIMGRGTLEMSTNDQHGQVTIFKYSPPSDEIPTRLHDFYFAALWPSPEESEKQPSAFTIGVGNDVNKKTVAKLLGTTLTEMNSETTTPHNKLMEYITKLMSDLKCNRIEVECARLETNPFYHELGYRTHFVTREDGVYAAMSKMLTE